MTFLEYLVDNNNLERFEFNSPDEAYNFGVRLRDIIAVEGDDECIEVDISNTVVRVRLNEPAIV
jgi:hypothetical protein